MDVVFRRLTDVSDTSEVSATTSVAASRAATEATLAELDRRLRAVVRGDVSTDAGTRALYSMDASNHRRVPQAVVLPRDVDDVVAAVGVARELGVPIVPRGGGTSIGGQATGLGLVLDFSRYMDAIESIDPERRLARVQPGVVLDDLRAAAAPHGLTFGPDPSTHSRCTIGGMIGNNACGSHSVAWGKTSENVESLDVLLADGTRMTVSALGRGAAARAELDRRSRLPGREGAIYAALRALVDDNLALIRTRIAASEDVRMTRRVSGYALDALLPEQGIDLARALVGTEGGCVIVLGATVRLVEAPKHRVLVVAGFPDEYAAADAVPALLPHRPLTVESLSPELLALASRTRVTETSGTGPELPPGTSWLLMEVGGDTVEAATAAGRALADAVPNADTRATALLIVEPAAQRAVWRVREDAAGSATRLPDGAEAWPGWEDAAVPVERLGPYLRAFRELMATYDLRGLPYGHFGEGCVHVRLGFDLASEGGVTEFARFMSDAADLVASFGGSLSGEHGDGLARSPYLARMFGDEAVALFARFKAIWDPENLMNPGVVVRPEPVDARLRFTSLRLAADRPDDTSSIAFALRDDRGSFDRAVRRCVGVGRCRTHGTLAEGSAMCPSFQVTRDERHSTRGRAHLLVEMLHGDVVTEGWRSPEVLDALDLCLSCKACKSECPVDVDMATYKAEFLHHHYARRVRPASHYALGWLPLWARLAALAPGIVNAITAIRPLAALLKRIAGIDQRRELPRFAATTLRRALRSRRRPTPATTEHRVMLWPDTFSSYLSPEVGVAAVRVLEAAGCDVVVPEGPVCCGLTWISTGQLDVARAVARRTLRALRPAVAAGLPIVVLEPSCADALRSDLPELLGDEPAVAVSRQVVSLAELLAARGWLPASAAEQRPAIGQVHCHQRASTGYDAERDLLAAAGVDLSIPQASCCGLAGNFGMERGHYEVSVACGEQALAPAVREASQDTPIVADGYSCRLQIEALTGRRALHSAQLLAASLPSPDDIEA
jgi:FAD/FMN-containing dehydrogenase/Fe-S oxidoreductase